MRLFLALCWLSKANPPRLMATIPAGTVPTLPPKLTLEVYEDLWTTVSAGTATGSSGPPPPPIYYKDKATGDVVYAITKSGEPIVAAATADLWGGHTLADVLGNESDLLAQTVIERDGSPDPTYDEVSKWAPPLIAEEIHCGDYALDSQSFIGSRIAENKRSFSAMGVEEYAGTRQQYHFDTTRLTANNTYAGLLGGFMPALRWHWPLSTQAAAPQSDGYVEQIAFAVPVTDTDSDTIVHTSAVQPVWLRFINVSADGRLRYAHYVDTFEQYPLYCKNTTGTDGDPKVATTTSWSPSQLECDGDRAVEFYTALLKFAMYWNSTLATEHAMSIAVPSHGIDIGNFVKHAIVREMITRRDTYFPRYGVPPMAYGSTCCDGFQDVFISGLATYLEWGLYPTAKGVLDNYFTYYVKRRGTVLYRGPELAQYGRTLTLVAQYYRQTADAVLLLKHAAKLVDMADVLLARRSEALLLDKVTDPSYGMIRGQDESDEILVGWTRNTTELPHFSLTLEAWRGFRDMGAVLAEVGAAHNRSDLRRAGATLSEHAPVVLHDVQVAMERSTVPANSTRGKRKRQRRAPVPTAAAKRAASGGTAAAAAVAADAGGRGVAGGTNASRAGAAPCHPYVAGEQTCGDMDAAGPHVSGTSGPYNFRASEPWRTYSSMFWSGGLTRTDAVEIQQYNMDNEKLSRMGVWSGGQHFENVLVSFTEQGHGYGLVQFGMVAPFLLQLYAEIAHDCSRGSWTCFEQRVIPNYTPPGGYATPAQLVVPLHVKWMLLFEDPIDGSLALCKACPRSWFEGGETISVVAAPIPSVSTGRISFNITSHLGAAVGSGSNEIVADVAFVATASASGVAAAAAESTALPTVVTLSFRTPLLPPQTQTQSPTPTPRSPASPYSKWLLTAVTVDGRAWHNFDPVKELVQLPPLPLPPPSTVLTSEASPAVRIVATYTPQ